MKKIFILTLSLCMLASCGSKVEVKKKQGVPLPATDGAGAMKWVPGRYQLAGITEGTGEIFILDASSRKVKKLAALSNTKSVNDKFQRLCLLPDGKKIVYIDGNSLASVEIDSGKKRRIRSEGKPIFVSASPDGRFLVYSSEKGVYSCSTEGTGNRQLSKDKTMYIQWSPDGKKIAYVKQPKGSISVLSIDGAKIKSFGSAAEGLVWMPDSKGMIVVKGLEFGMADTEAGSYKMLAYFTTLPNPAGTAGSNWLSLSSDGTKIAYNFEELEPKMEKNEAGKEEKVYYQENSDIYLLDLKSGKTVNISGTPDEWEQYPEYSGDGSHIFFYSKTQSGGKTVITPMLLDAR